MSYVKIGVGGPVGSGKTALIERITRKMSAEYSICVVTNDIYTKEDAEFLIKNSALAPERIVGVETGILRAGYRGIFCKMYGLKDGVNCSKFVPLWQRI